MFSTVPNGQVLIEMDLTHKQVEAAMEWCINHLVHVHNLMTDAKFSFPPGIDRHRPELWKGGSWRWFWERYKEPPQGVFKNVDGIICSV